VYDGKIDPQKKYVGHPTDFLFSHFQMFKNCGFFELWETQCDVFFGAIFFVVGHPTDFFWPPILM